MKTYVKKSSNFSISTKQSPCVNGQTVNSKLTFFRQIMTCVSSDDGHLLSKECRAQKSTPTGAELMLRRLLPMKRGAITTEKKKKLRCVHS